MTDVHFENWDRKIWHVRLFFWGLNMWDTFRGRDSMIGFEGYGTNICHYIRVLFVYMPFVVLSNLLLLCGAVYVGIWLPISLFGITGYMTTIALIVEITVATVLAFALIFCFIYGVKYINECREKRRAKQEAKNAHEEIEKTPGFFKVLGAWVVARERKMCFTIRFSKGGTSNA